MKPTIVAAKSSGPTDLIRRLRAGASQALHRIERPPAGVVAACVVTGLAAWVSLGVLAVTGDARSPRIGLLPPWWLPVIVAAAGVALASLGVVPRRAWRACWFPAILLLPWLPFPVPPAFLVWTGPVVLWVWLATAVSFVVAAWPEAGHPAASRAGRLAWLASDRRAPLAAFCIAVLIECGAAWHLSNILPAGDEPHYLIITQSLIQDGDLRIENNHRQRDYASYFPGFIRPDFLRRGKDGQIYSIHAPGLSVLVAPAFAVGSYGGVTVFLALISALAGALLWRLAFRLTASPAAAWFGWAAVMASTPYFFHAFRSYPDGTGAALILTGVAALVRLETETTGAAPAEPEASPPPRAAIDRVRWVLHGVALAALPWLHTRYVVAAVVLGACVGGRLLQQRRFRELAGFLAAPLVSAMAWFGYFYAIYGEFDPAAPYGHYTQSEWSNVPGGIVGLFFDQQFGLLPYAPALAFGVAGLAAILRERRRLGIEILVLVTSYLAAAAAYHMWWGGTSAPARFAVPVLLALGVPAAAAWRRWPRLRAAAAVALALTALATLTLAIGRQGGLLFNPRDGYALWLEWLWPLVDVPRALPAFLRDDPGPVALQTVVWLAAALGGALGLWWLAARGVARRALAIFAPWASALLVMCAVTVGWLAAGAVEITPTSSQLALMHAASAGTRPLGVAFRPLEIGGAADLLQRVRLSTSARRPPGRGPVPLLMLVDVPAGTYRVRPKGMAGRQGSVEMRVGRSTRPSERWSTGDLAGGVEALIRLPVGVNAVTMSAEAPEGAGAPKLELQPLSILPRSSRPTPERARRAARYGPFVVFSFDEEVFLEETGFWISGALDEHVVIGSDTPRESVALLLRNGLEPNIVRLGSGAGTVRLAFEPKEEKIVRLALDPASGATLLQLHAERGFRPSDSDPRNKDRRYLGVWVEMAGRQ